jgi:hypothetical protein
MIRSISNARRPGYQTGRRFYFRGRVAVNWRDQALADQTRNSY